MSDHIEHDGKTYIEISYLQGANETAKRRGRERDAARAQVAALQGALEAVLTELIMNRGKDTAFFMCRTSGKIPKSLLDAEAALAAIDGIKEDRCPDCCAPAAECALQGWKMKANHILCVLQWCFIAVGVILGVASIILKEPRP